MAKQRVVNTYFWSDDFILDLKPDEKLLFLYVLTNPQTDLCGAYEIALRKIVFETSLPEKRVLAILDKFARAGKVIYENGWMIVRNFAKHQVQNPKVKQGIARSLNDCPDWVKDRLSEPIIAYHSVSEPIVLKPKLKPKPYGSDEPREASFAERVLDGIKTELNVLQITKESDWLIEIERAEKNKFTAEHCIETFTLMNRQNWRDSPVRPETWSENLPILHKLRTETERKNGTNKPPSEREKSASRTINAERMANAIRDGDEATLQSILGMDGTDNIKGYLPS